MAIGASAGGFNAVQVVLRGLPGDLAAAVLIVQHMERHRDSRLPWLLGRSAALPVHPASDGEPILAGHVYVGVPNAHLIVHGDHLELGASALVKFVRPSIDVLFESVAGSHGPRAVGVILSGSGEDGAAGVCAIHRAGGVTIAQREAAYASMPAHAWATGGVDLMLPLHDIAPAIVDFVNGVREVGGARQ